MQNDFVSDVRSKANGYWPSILERLAIPTNHGEGPCPACGGKTRYRFDNKDNRGTYFCSHCGAGTGLDLVMKVNQCGAREAAELVAEAMALPMPEPKPAREKPQTDIAGKVAALAAKASPGQSAYLTSKGLQCPFPMLSDGSLLLVLKNGAGATTGAQVIKPDGSKRLVAGTVKKGSFCVVNSGETPETVIIAEGLATALSVQQFRTDATIIAAIDAGNLLPVAQVMRQRYPDAQIIIAADNDIKPGEPNTGKSAAEKTAKAVSGWVALPQSEEKADWNDFHQQHGLEAAAAAFNDSMYQPEGEKVKPALTIVEGGKVERHHKNDMKPYVDERKGGLYWIEPKLDKETGEITEKESWLSATLAVTGIGEDENERYLVLRWHPEGSDSERTEALPMRDIGEREGWAKLRAGGLSITAKSSLRAILADHLQRSGNREMWAIASATGWQCGAYIMPDGEVIGEPKTPVLFNGRSAAAKGYTVKGTAVSWRTTVAMLAKGNPSMMLGIYVEDQL